MTRAHRRYLQSAEFQRRCAELDARLEAGWIPASGLDVAAALGLPPAVAAEAMLPAIAALSPDRVLN